MKTKLLEVCDIQYGYAFDSKKFTDDDTYIPLVRIRDVKRGFSETFYTGEYTSEYIVNIGDLLVGMDGEFNIARWKSKDALLNQRVCKLVAKDGTNEEFIRFSLSKELKDIERRTAFVTVKHLSAKELNKLELSIPSFQEQEDISSQLVILERIIALRNQKLQMLDDLVKARFVELMEDSALSDETTIEMITKRVKVGFVGRCEEYYTDDSGIPMLRTGNIAKGGIDLSDIKYVTNDFHKMNKKSQINNGDLLIARHGSNGQASVYYGPEAQCLNAVIIVPNHRVASSVFLAGLINSPMVKQQIDKTLVGSTQHVINTKSIAGLNVRIPSMHVQKKYEEFVVRTDKSKAVEQKALDEAQLLFDSLMQEYFG